MPKNRAVDLQKAQQQALNFAREWLGKNVVVPDGVTVDEDQFAAIMNTVLRGLAQAYAAGYMESK